MVRMMFLILTEQSFVLSSRPFTAIVKCCDQGEYISGALVAPSPANKFY